MRQCATKSEKNGIYIEDAVADALARDLPIGPTFIVQAPPADPDMTELHGIAAGSQDDPTLFGNRVKAWAEKVGAVKAAELWEKWTGIPCGCPGRQALLNSAHETIRGIFGKLRGAA